MILKFEDNNGKTFKVETGDFLTLEEAQEIYDTALFSVIEVTKEEYGDFSNSRARDIIDNEGVGYAVTSYCSYVEFSDPKTRELWKQADNALNKLCDYVGADC